MQKQRKSLQGLNIRSELIEKMNGLRKILEARRFADQQTKNNNKQAIKKYREL